MTSIFAFCRGITHLDVSSCALVHGDELCKLLRNHAPNLIALDMFRVQNLTARGVFHLANIEKLQGCPIVVIGFLIPEIEFVALDSSWSTILRNWMSGGATPSTTPPAVWSSSFRTAQR